jgi:hypothetical protein
MASHLAKLIVNKIKTCEKLTVYVGETTFKEKPELNFNLEVL